MTQAGGGLRPDLIRAYAEAARRTGKRFFVMYGQTEATARMAYVPPDRLDEKIGAVGIAIPGGRLRLGPVPEHPGARQLVYEGANVMLGYANRPADLSLGDIQQGRLDTGDLGRVDEEGYFYVTGRLNRIAKMFGRRVNLADVENEVERRFACQAAAVEHGNRLRLLIQPIGDVDLKTVRQHTAQFLSVRPHAVQVELTGQIPLTSSGKKDYASLATQAAATRG
jgi:acyl-CoA synthetase (AMP-forming)/AMP-acid ligase II